MFDAHRLKGRFSYWMLTAFRVVASLMWSSVCVPMPMGAPTMTMVSDLVYRVEVSPASRSGSYLAKAGDTMTGPLTVLSDRTGTNQVSTKHYVGTGLSLKTNLIAGVVPAAQLGSGTPDGALCPKEDSSWDACSTSTNAIAIQNTAVAAQAKWAADVRDYGMDCTGSGASDRALNSGTAGRHVVVPQGCIVRLSTSNAYAFALEFKQGGQLKPDSGVTITLTGNVVAGRQQIFSGAGTIDFTGNIGITEVYPEWWGASPSASAAVNTRAFQAAEYGAFGQNRTNASGLSRWNKQLSLCGTYQIGGEIQFYHVLGFDIHGCAKLSSGIIQTAQNKRIIDGQNIAYGRIYNLSFSTIASQTVPLVDLDNDHKHGSDLSPQNITFDDVTFSGNNGRADVGVLIAKHGGDAQGDNIRCERCYFSGFSGAGWQVGGNNTGRNAGRFYAYNAIKELIKGGDCQGNPLYCIAVYAGSIEVDGTTMENDSAGFGTQTGFDVYCEAPQDRCVMRNVRSESHQLASGVGLIEHSRTMFQAASWYAAGRSQSLGGTVVNGTIYFSGTGQGGDGKYYVTTSTGTFGGLTLTTATSGTSTTLVNSGASYTTNAFVGQQATIVAGTGNGCYGVVTANNGTTITFAAGLVTNYYQLLCPVPDSTSQFVIEPNWAANPTSSGTVSFSLFDFQVIGGCSAGGSVQGNMGDCLIDDVAAPGGTSNIGGASSINRIRNFFPSRTDWGSSGFPMEDSVVANIWQNIVIERPDAVINVGGTQKWLNWGFRRNSGGNSFFKGPLFMDVGTQPICWSYGQNGGGQSANDVCIGIRTDNGSLKSEGRAVLGILGTVGPVTPFGSNKPGVDLPVSGGLSTGNGKPGGISFRLGTPGDAGGQVNDSNEVARIDVNGYKLPAFTFAKLPAAPNGYVVFCIDCNPECTSGRGKGRTCFRENGRWTH